MLRQRVTYTGSARYWQQNYARGGTSDPGSYGALAHGNARFLNAFVREHEVHSITEFGCVDGHQLSRTEYPGYVGPDASSAAIDLCKHQFSDDPAKSFFPHDGARFIDGASLFAADLAFSLDVIYPN